MIPVLGLDPGPEHSALVNFNGVTVTGQAINVNDELLGHLVASKGADVLVIEQVESFGMAVGKEVFETVFWSGKFAQAWWPRRVERLPRRIIKQHLCHTARATDANIRQALIDRFGGTAQAIGLKKSPGPLYGIKSHAWAALAVAVTWADQHGHEPAELRPGIRPEF